MKWPWNKNERKLKNEESPKDDGQIKLPDFYTYKPKPVEIEEDWLVDHSDWRRDLICHCGRHSPLNFMGACPSCGHHDRFEPITWRHEWEYSPSRHRAKLNESLVGWVGYPDLFAPWNRNRKYVVWAPEYCTMKDENEPER